MWSPTHVQVTVYRARNLIVKGKAGTNDTYVTIKLDEEKYQTSIKERSKDPAWMEECDLLLSDPQSIVQLNIYHRNLLGLDEFLGHAEIPLEDIQIYERPRSRWYALRNKVGSKKPEKYRGEIEVKITFIVQSNAGSLLDMTKKTSVKRSGSIKTLAQTVGEKMTKKWPSKGSLTPSGSRPDLSGSSDVGDQSPKVRKIHKKDMSRSHSILPTSFNNQHLQEQEDKDKLDDSGTKKSKDRDFDRWQNPLAPFRRKKKSRLSKMSLLSQSTHTLDRSITSEAPGDDLEEEDKVDGIMNFKRQKPMLAAKSMFDLSSPSLEDDITMHRVEAEPMNTSFDDAMVDQSACGGHGNIKEGLPQGEEEENSTKHSQQFINNLTNDEKFPELSNMPYQERSVDVLPKQPSLAQQEVMQLDFKPSSCSTPEKLVEKPPKPPRSLESPQKSLVESTLNPIQSPSEVTSKGHADLGQGHEIQKAVEQIADKPLEDSAHESHPVTIETNASENTMEKCKASESMDPTESDRSMYISSSESDQAASPETSPHKTNEHVEPQNGGLDRQTDEQVSVISDDSSHTDLANNSQGNAEDRKKEKLDKYKKMKDVNRRHTLQYGRNNVPRAAAHDLHENIAEYRQKAREFKERELPAEVIKQFDDKSREDLIRLILEQNMELHRKEVYNRDMESYIDNLLVKVMEVTPKLLQHPSSRSPVRTPRGEQITNGVDVTAISTTRSPSTPLMLSSANHNKMNQSPMKNRQANNNVVNVNNSNNRNNTTNKTVKKPFNPFKKLQQALK